MKERIVSRMCLQLNL